MRVRINGQDEQFHDDATVADVLRRFRREPRRVAGVVNRALVPRPDYDATALHDGDQLEIVTFVGGG